MLTWLDLLLLAIVGISALVGLWRGLIVEVMALVVWTAAFWLALAFGVQVADLYQDVVAAPTARWALGYATVFLLALGIGSLVTWILRKLVKGSGLSGSDRVLGLGFGLLRGAAVACVLVLVAGFTPLPQEPAWREAQVVPGFVRGAQWLQTWLPQALAERVSFDALLQALPQMPLPRDNGAPSGAATGAQQPDQLSTPEPIRPAI